MSRQRAQLLAGVLVLLAFLLTTASADIRPYPRGHGKSLTPDPGAVGCCAAVWACLVGACARLCSCCRRPQPASPPAPYRPRLGTGPGGERLP